MARFLPPITGTQPQDLSVAQVARELNCAPKTVLSLAHRGKLPGYRVGRLWRFRRQALDAFKRSIDTSTPPPPATRRAATRGGVLPGWNDFD